MLQLYNTLSMKHKVNKITETSIVKKKTHLFCILFIYFLDIESVEQFHLNGIKYHDEESVSWFFLLNAAVLMI